MTRPRASRARLRDLAARRAATEARPEPVTAAHFQALVDAGALTADEATDWAAAIGRLNAVTERLGELAVAGERLEATRPPLRIPWTLARQIAYGLWDRRRDAHNAELARLTVEGRALHARVQAYTRRVAPLVEGVSV
jgi:hypothetical protein